MCAANLRSLKTATRKHVVIAATTAPLARFMYDDRFKSLCIFFHNEVANRHIETGAEARRSSRELVQLLMTHSTEAFDFERSLHEFEKNNQVR